MLTLSLESNDREPGTIYRSLICKENPPNNRSHPTTGNDSTRERFMTAPALALIVPTRSIVPGREPGSRERFTHLGGSSTVMVVTVVMVTAYCYGRRTHTCPRQKGSFLAIFQYGGRERSISPPSDPKTRFAGFAVRTRRCGAVGRMPDERGPVRDGGNADGANLGAYPVCRFAPRLCEKRPGIKTQCWRGLAADSLAGLQKSAHEPLRTV